MVIQRTPDDVEAYVSTGALPGPEDVSRLVAEAHRRFLGNTEGEVSQTYPALAEVPSDLFGLCVVGSSGRVHAAGDADYEFSIMSVSKPFTFALVCQELPRPRLNLFASRSALLPSQAPK